uniref:Uncharacterized protein n=1 Tax=Anguilla anguilla TaxID=7936 RepID=A0A0E9SWW3_ANGAN
MLAHLLDREIDSYGHMIWLKPETGWTTDVVLDYLLCCTLHKYLLC